MEIATSHENTDFDGLASILGAVKLYPKAIAVLPQRLNRNLQDFLAVYWDELPFVYRADMPRGRIELLIVVDTQSIPSFKGLTGETEVRIIDHHPLERDLEPNTSFHTEDVGSTASLLVEQIVQSQSAVSPVEATLLLLGIYEDTGSLSYPGTRALDARCAAWLLEQGANLEVVNEFLHRPLSEAQQQLYRRLVEAVEFHDFAGHTVVVAALNAPEFQEEISTLAHKLRDLYEPAALFIIVGLEASVQLVARSNSDAIDVADMSRHFGGGGHSKAAAALIRDGGVEYIRERLLHLLGQEVRPSTTVADLMSHGAYTLSPDTLVRDAAEVMRRYGHEGFPVVAKSGKVLGMLTRREIDKALQYERENAPIGSYMRKGEIVVAPSDSVDRLQDVMIQHAVGQVAVVENGEIVGIVTRTDLIELWAHTRATAPGGDLGERVRSALPESVLQRVLKASELAREMGYSLYLVGGFVRDLLLGKAQLDLDIVVEGDAIALAKGLSQITGGRVHSHSRFGTAKLIWDDQDEATSSIDFTTARREFYEYSTALPQVERSSIKQDLYRRDFTINTMAISLNENTFGELLDFYGGERDLKEGLIRVLHNLSFIEDPIRMLRAVRLEQRLGFRLEEMTEDLISDALEWLDRVSGERIRQELDAVFQEDDPVGPLRRLSELSVLRQISPLLEWDAWLEDRMLRYEDAATRWGARLSKLQAQPKSRRPTLAMTYLALVSIRAGEKGIQSLAERLRLPKDETRLLLDAQLLNSLLPSLTEQGLSRSSLYRLLAPHPDPAIFVWWLSSDDDLVRERLELYHTELRSVEPVIDGDELRQMGLPPGPQYAEILGALRDAKLDGRVASLQDERAEVQRLIAENDEKGRGA